MASKPDDSGFNLSSNSSTVKFLVDERSNDVQTNLEITINAWSIKFGTCNEDKQGILMQQFAL
uniref:Uncharacterized protein n=1 Tax=Romanomermis culicivorax TaxID=13658 RepID=A0A915KMU7_ROMCU